MVRCASQRSARTKFRRLVNQHEDGVAAPILERAGAVAAARAGAGAATVAATASETAGFR